jgi:hypothetical protein
LRLFFSIHAASQADCVYLFECIFVSGGRGGKLVYQRLDFLSLIWPAELLKAVARADEDFQALFEFSRGAKELPQVQPHRANASEAA